MSVRTAKEEKMSRKRLVERECRVRQKKKDVEEEVCREGVSLPNTGGVGQHGKVYLSRAEALAGGAERVRAS
jgi:hypothetical protein